MENKFLGISESDARFNVKGKKTSDKQGKICFREWKVEEIQKYNPDRIIKTHPFNHQFEIVIPWSLKSPIPKFQEILSSNILTNLNNNQNNIHFSYYICFGSLSVFIDINFIQEYLKKGDLYVLSYLSKIDSEDIFQITNGILILSLLKETYETLGLTGKKCTANGLNYKYIVEIDLCEESFQSDRKFFKRVAACLKNLKPFNFLASYSRDSKEFPINWGLEIKNKKIPLKTNFEKYFNIKIPSFQLISQKSIPTQFINELTDWFNLIHTHSNKFIGNFFSECEELKEEKIYQQIITIKGQGFFPPWLIIELKNSIFEFQKKSQLPWTSLQIWGFEDSVTSWNEHLQNFDFYGSNNYLYICFPEKFWTFQFVDKHF